MNSSSGFTFHYGSILIQYAGLTLLFVRIYIPLWFYSNESIKKIFEERKIYIPLWFYSNVIPCFSKWLNVFIYIPLWFYSNQNLFLEIASLHEIYIPLWFYSNIVILIIILRQCLFTFHYGSILIDIKNLRHKRPNTFTFHYGSILIEILFNKMKASD